MASDSGTTQHALSALLGVASGRAPRLGFYAALRRIECAYRELPRLGEALTTRQEPVRLGQTPSLAFEAAALTAIVDGDETRPAQLNVSFFGVFGPQGPLPLHMTEYVLQRRTQHGDPTWSRFVDIFHHRLLSLFYRAWANTQPTVNYDRPGQDRFARYLGALLGQRRPAPSVDSEPLDQAALFSAVHFVGQTRHAEGLAKVLRSYFDVAVEIEEFVGQWLDIPEPFCWTLGTTGASGGVTIGLLGESTRLGGQLWDIQSKFRVVIGPVGRADYERFLPGGDRLRQLSELVTRYAGPELGWDLRLVLRKPERQGAILGESGLLGHTAHLGSTRGDDSPEFEDLVLDSVGHAA